MVANVAAFAADDLTADTSISITKLEANDQVNFYQVLQFSDNAQTTGGWVATSAFAYDATNNPNGLKEADIQLMLSLDSTGKYVTTIQNAGVSAELAAKLADIAENVSATYANVAATGTGEEKTATYDNPTPGLYLALVTPGNAATLYNPMIVGADYKSNTSNSWEVSLSPSYSPVSIAKKSTVTLEKTASTTEAAYEDSQPETVAVGDTVNFTVVTKIPVYADNYTKAVFNVIDTLSSGLELDTSSITVYADTKTVDETKVLTATSGDNKTYTLDPAATKAGYTVKFDTDYILGDGRGKDITITYSAKVTTAAPFSVNLEKNTVEVHFSNSPTDETGAGKLRDDTKHYTFDIDGNILGETAGQWPTTEVVKVGLGPDGKEIYERTTTLHQGQTKVGALEGATFKLYVADSNGSLSIKDYQNNDLKLTQYTNDILTSGKTIVSDSNGRLTIQGESNPGIRGLDIGTYYLVEETAPQGYIKHQNAVKVEIIAPKPEGNATENAYWKLVEYTDSAYLKPWTVWELLKYDVKIDGVQTASYTFRNQGQMDGEAVPYGDSTIISTKTDTITGADAAGLIGAEGATAAAGYGKITNTQGVELPSTGGMGTTILYVGGSILVILAAILLITKRRMNAED